LALYRLPTFHHEPVYGDEMAYNEFYLGQLHELMTKYGSLVEVWFDGAKGENAKEMEYDFDAFWATVRQRQPDAVLFSDAGPDIRWIGNERGYAGETNWSTMDRSKVGIGWHGIGDYLNTGEAGTTDWIPGECNTSIRPGWFWHPNEQPKPLDQLMDIYFGSVGRNCTLLLNIPPNRDGLFSETDVTRLYEFKAARDAIFSVDLARGKNSTASTVRGRDDAFGAHRVLDHDPQTYWATDNGVTTGELEIDLGAPTAFNVIRIEEPIALGQRVAAYRVEAEIDGSWQVVSQGTTIGYRKLDRTSAVLTAQRVRLVIEKALANPLISEFGLHLDPAR
jgi:alpha-L-fucosidase